MRCPEELVVVIFGGEEGQWQKLSDQFVASGVKRVHHEDAFAKAAACLKALQADVVVVSDRCVDGDVWAALAHLKNIQKEKPLPIWIHTSCQDAKRLQAMVSAENTEGILYAPPSLSRVKHMLRNIRRLRLEDNLIEMMRESSFLAKFPHADLKRLASQGFLRCYSAGATIISKGDPCDSFFVLLEGRVDVMLSKLMESPLHITIEKGQSFGEMGIMDGAPRSAYCLAAEECLVLEFGKHVMDCNGEMWHGPLVLAIAEVVTRRLRNADAMLERRNDKPSPAPAVTSPQETKPNKTTSKPRVSKKDPINTSPSLSDYDVLARKVNLRSDFITSRLPKAFCEALANKMYGYWTGSKLAKLNPHRLFNPKWFTEGTARLKKSLHLVVVCDWGMEAYKESFLGLAFTHRVVGLSGTGCSGTFLGDEAAVEAYFKGEAPLQTLPNDYEIPLERESNGTETVEYLSHTRKDVREGTVFLVFDDAMGQNTAKIRTLLPEHQIVTVVRGFGGDIDDLSKLFNQLEDALARQGLLLPKDQYKQKGFYQGETVFFPDLSPLYRGSEALEKYGALFGMMGLLAKIGPDYSGPVWGSRGGAEGAVKAARARYGLKSALTAEELASAVTWADGQLE